MEQLTKRQMIALEILKGRRGLIDGDEDMQENAICDSLNFAELFLAISTPAEDD